MKLTMIFLTLAFLQVSAKGISQNVTFSARNVPIKEVFIAIEKQTGYVFFYEANLLKDARPVSVDLKNTPLETVLKQIFKDQPFTYSVVDKTITIVKKVSSIDTGTEVSSPPPIDVRGRVVDDEGKPVAGASVTIKGTQRGTTTNDSGYFFLRGVEENAVLIFRSVNTELREVAINGRSDLANISLKGTAAKLDDVSVVMNTGYQQIPKERATGSFVTIDSSIINRRVSTNILDRLDGVTSSLIFNKNGGINQSEITIRGRSTIFANPNPLIVLDNFPYEGDLSTINPNDVESITILRDAAAASIWGARSGNGVIIITTKKGKYNQGLKVSFNTNVTFGAKPDLDYEPRINTSDIIDLQLYLDSKGLYNSVQNPSSRSAVSPVVEILAMRKQGLISAADSASQIDALRNINNRQDIREYVYQKSVNQQYSINLSGGGSSNQYSFTLGYDNNLPNLRYNSYERYVVSLSNTYKFFRDKLELGGNFRYIQSNTADNNPGAVGAVGIPGINTPYVKIAGPNGEALPVAFTGMRIRYVDTAGQGRLLDWHYYPLDELRYSDNQTKLIDYHLRLSSKYKILEGLDVAAIYEYSNGLWDNKDLESQRVYSTRNIINLYSQVNFSSGNVSRPIPLGDILKSSFTQYHSHQLRTQLSYDKNWNGLHQVSSIVGFELRDYVATNQRNQYYGFDDETQTYSNNINYDSLFRTYVTGAAARIPNNSSAIRSINHFLSYFFNVGYTYKSKYTLTGSLRKDEANILGNETNNKGVPLWSAGLGWNLSKESFYSSKLLPNLKLRITYGYNGNLDLNAVSTLAISLSNSVNLFNNPYSSIATNPNDQLRWEKTEIINVGVDFGSINNVLKGSVEYFLKRGTDILGNGLIAPQTGLTTFYGNIADMRSSGLDLSLQSNVRITKHLTWSGIFQISHLRERVTDYKVKQNSISAYVNPTSMVPLEGYPLYSIFSYKYAGLDPLGNPQVMLDGKVSQAYSSLTSSSDLNNLVYNGSSTPTTFGNLLNIFSYGKFSFSFNIVYKLGYVFRRSSVDYTSLFSSFIPTGHPDYHKRWQKQGDENFTYVPALLYPNNTARNLVYRFSDVLVEKGDHVRLQDINISYQLERSSKVRIPARSITLYATANNIGILWKATQTDIDPDYVTGIPIPFSFSLGAKFTF